MPVSALSDFFFFMRRPSLVKLDFRNDLSRDPLFDGPAPLNPLRNLMVELLILPLWAIDDGLISIDDVDADDLRRKLPDFFDAFGYLNGLNDADGCGSIWYEQHGISGLNEVVGWSMNADRSSAAAIVGFGVAVGTSSDFKFKLLMAFMSKFCAVSFVSAFISPPVNFLFTTTFWRFVGIGGAVDVDAITSHNTFPFFRPNDTVVDFSFLPYDMDGLLVVRRSLFSLHTSGVSGELHAVDDFRDFNFVWDALA